jgi:hypothetical protein
MNIFSYLTLASLYAGNGRTFVSDLYSDGKKLGFYLGKPKSLPRF